MLYNRVGKRKKTMAPDNIIEKRLIMQHNLRHMLNISFDEKGYANF